MSGPVFEFELGQEIDTPRGPMFVATRWFDASGPVPGLRYGVRSDLDNPHEPQVTYSEREISRREPVYLPAEGYKFAIGQEVNTPDGPRVISHRWCGVSPVRVHAFYRVHPRDQTSPLRTWREDQLLELNPVAPVFVGIDRASGPDQAVFRSVRGGRHCEKLAAERIKDLTGGGQFPTPCLAPNCLEIGSDFKLTIASGRLPELGGDGDEIWRRVEMVPEGASELEVEVDRVSYLEGSLRLSGERIAELWAEKEQLAAEGAELREELTRTDGELSDLRLEAGGSIADLEKELEAMRAGKVKLEGDFERLRACSKPRICELENRVETLREINAEQAQALGEHDRQEQRFLREVDGLGEDFSNLAGVNAQLMEQVEGLNGEVEGLVSSLRAEKLRREGGEILLADAQEAIENLEAELKASRASAANALAGVELIDAQKDGVLEAVQAVMREAANG